MVPEVLELSCTQRNQKRVHGHLTVLSWTVSSSTRVIRDVAGLHVTQDSVGRVAPRVSVHLMFRVEADKSLDRPSKSFPKLYKVHL
jgi:hypothetical protein